MRPGHGTYHLPCILLLKPGHVALMKAQKCSLAVCRGKKKIGLLGDILSLSQDVKSRQLSNN